MKTMKKVTNILGALAIAAALTAGFTACTNEDTLLEEQQTVQAPTYSVSIPANIGGAETRAVELGTGDKAGYLVSTFEVEDKIFATVISNGDTQGAYSSQLKPDAAGKTANIVSATGSGVSFYNENGAVTLAGNETLLLVNRCRSGKSSFDYTDQDGTISGDNGLTRRDYSCATVTVQSLTGGVLTTTKADFQNAQSMYKFTFTGLPTGVGVKSVKISSGSNKLVREYWPEKSLILPTCASVTITLGDAARTANGAGVVYAALRFQELSANATDNITFTVTGTDDKTYTATKTSPVGGFNNGKYYTSTIALLPQELLGGRFTINDSGTKVCFAPGNLQATYSTNHSWTWHFAEHQWDFIGNAAGNTCINGNGTMSASGTVDLFGWVGSSNTTWTGVAQYGITNSMETDGTTSYGNSTSDALKSDWGNIISDGYTWRTLTMAEWKYVFERRTSGTTVGQIGVTQNCATNARYTLAKINTDNGSNGVKGIILFPDNVEIATSEFSNRGNIYGSKSTQNKNNTTTECTTAQWAALAAKGCVFLPCAGYRSGSTVYKVGTTNPAGYYWSSSPHTSVVSEALYVVFGTGALNLESETFRRTGCSVRLVREVE